MPIELAGPRLQRLTRGGAVMATPVAPMRRCDLCAAPLDESHRHLLDLGPRALLCACRACAVLFDRHEAGGRRYRLVPERCRRLTGFALDDEQWGALDVPVSLAFFVHVADAGRVVAFYPSPLGVTDARVDVDAWARLRAANPVLGELEDDVEALLVNRVRDAREHWLAPLDVGYRLAAIVRTHWKGIGGGQDVWAEIDRFFESLPEKGGR